MTVSLTGTAELNENEVSSKIAEKREAKPSEIYGKDGIDSIAFVADGDYIVDGDGNKIRRWRAKDGEGVVQPIDTTGDVYSVAVPRDGKRIMSGMRSGQVTAWGARRTHKKMIDFRGHSDWVFAMDVSPDATKIASRSWDLTACVYLLSTGEQVLGPFKNDGSVATVRFFPDGQLVSAATWCCKCVRIYDSPMAAASSTRQSKSARTATSPSPGSAPASNCLRCRILAPPTVSTCPGGKCSLAGPSTATTVQHHDASPRQATAHSSQPLPTHRSHSGTLLHAGKSTLLSIIQLMSTS